MLKVRLILFLLILPLSGHSFAKEYKTTKEAMNEIFKAFVDLVPYAGNEMKFKDPKSEEYIKDRLLKLKTAFQNAKHLKQISTPGFSPSYETISEHLDQTYEGFSTSQKSFARSRLKATAEMCISCHTQLSDGKSHTFSSLSKVTRESFENDYEYADYLFLIRNYTQAAQYYRQEIRSRIQKNKELRKIQNTQKAVFIDFTIEKSLERLLTIYTKVFFKPEKALKEMMAQKSVAGMPASLVQKLEDWKEDLQKWSKEKVSELKTAKDVEAFLAKYAEEEINQISSHVDLLVISGFLYRHLNNYPSTKAEPQILLSLGAIDEVLNHSYFFSLSEVYLKRCIKKFPKSPFAKKCFNRYKDKIEFGYTGTAGTNIPPEEKAELARLKKILSDAK